MGSSNSCASNNIADKLIRDHRPSSRRSCGPVPFVLFDFCPSLTASDAHTYIYLCLTRSRNGANISIARMDRIRANGSRLPLLDVHDLDVHRFQADLSVLIHWLRIPTRHVQSWCPLRLIRLKHPIGTASGSAASFVSTDAQSDLPAAVNQAAVEITD